MKPDKLDVKLIEIDKIIPHEANERLHPDENIEFLKKGLDDFSQQKPIVVDKKNKIIAGHGIWLAAKKSGFNENRRKAPGFIHGEDVNRLFHGFRFNGGICY